MINGPLIRQMRLISTDFFVIQKETKKISKNQSYQSNQWANSH